MPDDPAATPSRWPAALRLMAVHAHPDDESSKGAATMARYVRSGVDVMVCTLTGGERGDILNKAMDRPEIRANLSRVRREEMARAREILGVRQQFLGFTDSGLPEGDGAKAGMAFIPGGTFVMGSDRQQPGERFTHIVRVDPFWIERHEVTNAQFSRFVAATPYVHARRARARRGADPRHLRRHGRAPPLSLCA